MSCSKIFHIKGLFENKSNRVTGWNPILNFGECATYFHCWEVCKPVDILFRSREDRIELGQGVLIHFNLGEGRV